MKTFRKYFLFFGFWGILIAGIYFYGRVRNSEIEKYKEFAIGTITDYGFGGSGTIILHYSFKVNETHYYGDDGMRVRRSYYSIFSGKNFPVIFSSRNPNNHHILMLPEDFESWNIPFPDSLGWVEQYKKW